MLFAVILSWCYSFSCCSILDEFLDPSYGIIRCFKATKMNYFLIYSSRLLAFGENYEVIYGHSLIKDAASFHKIF